MLLVDQVEVLRKNLPEIMEMRCVLPLSGGYKDTRAVYRFAYLVLPARDIITTIMAADPGGNVLPGHLREWNLGAKDEYGEEVQVPLKRILGMIIHMHYLHVGEKLDVSNDSNERRIVSRDMFLQGIKRLVLTYEDICLVACALAERSCNGETIKNRKTSPWDPEGPGCRDLQKVLRDIWLCSELPKSFGMRTSRIKAKISGRTPM